MLRPAVCALLLLAATLPAAAQSARPLYRDTTASIDARVRDLVGRMTIDEKFWQLFMIPGDLDDSTHDYSNGVFGLQVRLPEKPDPNAARTHAERINTIQRYFVE